MKEERILAVSKMNTLIKHTDKQSLFEINRRMNDSLNTIDASKTYLKDQQSARSMLIK